MSLLHAFGLLTRPRAEWSAIHDRHYGVATPFFTHTVIFALIPAVAGFYGTTRTGWQIGAGDAVRLTEESAARIAILYYLAMVAATCKVAWMIHWMSRTYGASQPFGQCYALATYTATPLFLAGLMHLQPILWLNLLVGLPVLGYTVYLFYTGVPVMMEIPEERGFLFSSAVMAFGLVALVALLAISVLLWSWGFGPSFTS
jgi:hypothetical protein